MTEENGYTDWKDHPRWQELCLLCNDIERKKEQAKILRKLIQEEIWGKEDENEKI